MSLNLAGGGGGGAGNPPPKGGGGNKKSKNMLFREGNFFSREGKRIIDKRKSMSKQNFEPELLIFNVQQVTYLNVYTVGQTC